MWWPRESWGRAMTDAQPMKSASDRSDRSDPFGILELFRSDPPPHVSDQSDQPRRGPTGPTSASQGRTEITSQNQCGPTGPTGPTNIEGGAPAAPLAKHPGSPDTLKCASLARALWSENAARADGLHPDAGAYLDRLRLHGPATYGAMASAMGWDATRAWRAEAKLRASGLVHYQQGKAIPKSRKPEI